MKILLDECLPVRLRSHLPGHDVFTVSYLKWKSIANGRLISLAASQGFDVLITSDSAVEQQQNVADLSLSVIILHPNSNSIEDMIDLVPKILTRLNEITKAPTILHVRR